MASASAESADSRLLIRIKAVDKLAVTDGGTLELAGVPGEERLSPATSTASISYTHNKSQPQKLVAEVGSQAAPAPSANDIVLSVSLQGGTGPKTLYNDGGTTGPADLLNGIGAGTLDALSLTYSAECTTSGTSVSSDTEFEFTVTYTSVEE